MIDPRSPALARHRYQLFANASFSKWRQDRQRLDRLMSDQSMCELTS